MTTGIAPARGGSTWEAFGCMAVLRTADRTRLAAAEEAVRRELNAIDAACSRFRSDSELSALNAAAGSQVVVSPLLAEAIELSLRAAELTGGAVDPTVGRCLQLAGYDRDWRAISESAASGQQNLAGGGDPPGPPGAAPAAAVTARVVAGWRSVAFDAHGRRVKIPAGVVLDLGATAKALAADRAAVAAAAASGCGVLVGIGGDLALAGPAPQGGWSVKVTDNHRASPDAPGQTIYMSSGGLATSSITVRRWRHGRGEMHHIIDPATGSPARSPWRTVSVAAASCADANIAATAVLVKRADGASWLRAKGLPARLVDKRGMVLRLSGWPEEAHGREEARRPDEARGPENGRR